MNFFCYFVCFELFFVSFMLNVKIRRIGLLIIIVINDYLLFDYFKTLVLPVPAHLRVHASQLKEKNKLPYHPLHPLRMQPKPPRIMKRTIFQENNNYTVDIKTNSQNRTCSHNQQYETNTHRNSQSTQPKHTRQ